MHGCPVECDECIDPGSLSGGDITVDSDIACVGGTITFTASGVVDLGWVQREDCVPLSHPGVAVEYAWSQTVRPDYPPPLPPLTGSGAVATVDANAPGTYTCTFTVTADRPCPPPPIQLPPASAAAAQWNLTFANGGSDLDGGESAGNLGPEVAEGDEEATGGFVLVNWDDDNADGVMNADGSWVTEPLPDLYETTVVNEDNLGRLT